MLPSSKGLIPILLFLTVFEKSDQTGARHKRFVAFRKGSAFFYRLNYKVNTLPYTTIFAQASGFKVAWELPTGQQSGKGRTASLEDIREGASLVYESHGFDGKMCLLKSLCQATEYIKERDGVLMKILNLLSGSYSVNGTSVLDPLVCRNYANHCPLHLIRRLAVIDSYKNDREIFGKYSAIPKFTSPLDASFDECQKCSLKRK